MHKDSPARSQDALKTFFSKYTIYLVLLAMVILLTIATPKFLTWSNLVYMLRQITVIGLLAMGMGMVIISKGIDLSVGSIIALSAVISASLAQVPDATDKFYPGLGHMPMLLVILVGIGVGLVVGLINGGLIAYLHLPAFIATLSTMTVIRALALIYTDGKPISFLTPEFEYIGKGYLGPIPIPVAILIVVILITWYILNRTKFGMTIYAIGGNAQAARVSGIRVKRNTVLVYAYTGALAGLAGIVLCSRVSSGQPNFGLSYEFDAITAVTIGGVSHSGGIGKVGGMISGLIILGVIANGMNLLSVPAYWQQVAKGCIIAIAVIIDMRKYGKAD